MNQTISWNQNQNSAIVSMGYDNIETNINLSQGHGSIFPDPSVVGPYNIIWWNISDYSNPSNDPFAEVVRCIAKMNDTLIVIRSQQQTLASPKNLYNKLYNVAPLPYNNIEALSYYNLPQPHGASSHTGTIGNHTTNLSNVGSNTHAQIDTALTASAGHITAVGTSVHSLGTMSTQSAGSVTITGGSIAGITSMGIGTASPLSLLEIYGDGVRPCINFPSVTSYACFVFRQNGAERALFEYMGTSFSDGGRANSLEILTLGGTTADIAFRPNDSEAMRIKSGGNVGIGTASPDRKLTVVGASSAWGDSLGILQITSGTGASADNKLIFGVHDSDYSWIQAVQPTVGLRNLALQLGGGNVGIGTTSPSVKLTVSNRIGILDGNDFVGTNPGAFTFTSSRAAASPNNFGTNYEQWFIGTGDISGWSGVSDFNIFQLVPGSAYHNRLHIDNTGNVGIGTASPPEKLSINGAINFANQNSDKKLYSPTDGDLEWFTHNSAAGHGLAVSHQGTKYVYLNTSGNSYLNGGYVGIGTASPTAKLHVGGTPGVDGIKFPDGTLQTTAATATPATHNFLRFMNTNLMTDYILGVATITRDMVAGTYTLDVPGGGNGYSIQNYKEVLSSKPRILVFRFTSAYDANWTVNIPAPVIGFGADDNNYIGLQLVNSQWYISAKNAVGYPQMLAISLSAGQLITLCVTNASILCYANGVYKGAVTTKIPTVSLGVWMRIAYGNCGISLDYLTYYSL